MSNSVVDFCKFVISKRGFPDTVPPEELAEDFVFYFKLSSQPTLSELRLLARQSGLGRIEGRYLPQGMSGFHWGYVGTGRIILYEEGDWTVRQEHTILHECCEIIQEEFEALFSGYRRPAERKLCGDANRFARAILMQPDIFREMLFDSGFDLIRMRHRMCEPYPAMPKRVAQLLRNGPDLLAAVYKRQGSFAKWGSPSLDEFVVESVAIRGGITMGGKGPNYESLCYPLHLMPRERGRGHPVMGSSVGEVILRGTPVFMEKVTGFDLWGLNDLSILARPMFWHRSQVTKLARIVLVGVRYVDRHLLDPQLDNVKPDIIRESYQLI